MINRCVPPGPSATRVVVSDGAGHVTIFKLRTEADYLAKVCNEDDPGWIYKVIARPDGRFTVAIYDRADGSFLGCL